MIEVIKAWQCHGDFGRSYRALQAEARTLLRTRAAA
jgi:hypothetical protein